MKIYIDNEYKCHVVPGEGLTPEETSIFDGKCDRYINGYRYIPAGKSWTRPDGQVFYGKMIIPSEDIRILEAAQNAYEQALSETAEKIDDLTSALDVIYAGGVTE